VKIELKAKVVEVSSIGVYLEVEEASDGDESIMPTDGMSRTFVACDDVATLRTFGAVLFIENGVRITVEAIGESK
jgi:hypothetical protein